MRHADNHEIILEILDVRIDLVNDKNHFGQVKGGFIKLRCSFAKTGVHIEEIIENRGSFWLIVNGRRIGFASVDDYRYDQHYDPDPVVHRNFCYVPVRYSARCEEGVQAGVVMDVPRVAGVILQSTGSESHRQYMRVGSFTILSSPEDFQFACRQYTDQSKQVEMGYYSEQWGKNMKL